MKVFARRERATCFSIVRYVTERKGNFFVDGGVLSGGSGTCLIKIETVVERVMPLTPIIMLFRAPEIPAKY